MQTKTSEIIDVGHSQVAYWRVGRGPDLVFVHGWPLSSLTYRHLVRALQSDFTCHLFDLPGAGDTEWTDASKIGLRQHAATIRQVIDHLGLKDYALVAHDSGAVMARYVAANNPAVRALVFSNSEIPHHRSRWVQWMCRLAQVPGGAALMRPFMTWKWLRQSKWSLGGCFTSPDYGEGEFFRLQLQPLLDDKRQYQGQTMLAKNLDWREVDALAELHREITADTLMIWGDADDVYFPGEKARAMAHQFGGHTEFVGIPDGKLYLHEDHADEFVIHARPFLLRAFGSSLLSAVR